MGNMSDDFFVKATDLGPSWAGVCAGKSADKLMADGVDLHEPCPECHLNLVAV